MQPGLNVVCLSLGRSHLRIVAGAGGDEDLAQPNTLRLRVVLLVLLVVTFRFARREAEGGSNLLAHHFLGDDAVADIGLEVLKRYALILGGLLEIFNGVEMVLLANLIQFLDEFGVTVDAQFLAL